MHLFRVRWIRSIVLINTMILFVNLTFLQIEVVLLGLNENRELISSFSFLLDLNAIEEQQEKSETPDNDPAKEVDIMLHDAHFHHASLFLLSHSAGHLSNDDLYDHGYLKKFCPPPEA